MSIVTETLTADGITPIGADHPVTAHLIAVGYAGSGGQRRTIVGNSLVRATAKTDATGTYTIDLLPNVDITPAGTRWVISHRAGTFEVIVPAGPAPEGGWQRADITVSGPVDIDPSALALHQAVVGPGGHVPVQGDAADTDVLTPDGWATPAAGGGGDHDDADHDTLATTAALTALAAVVDTKAGQDALDALTAAVAAKADPADITAAVDALVGAAPGALDTLAELAAALDDDADFAATITTALAGKEATGVAAILLEPVSAQAARVGERARFFPTVNPVATYAADDFANAYSGTSALDTAVYRSGTSAYRSTAPVGTAAFGASLAVANEDWSADSLLVTIRSDDWAAITDGYVIAWSPGAEWVFQINPHLSELADDEWYDLPLVISRFAVSSGSPVWDDVTSLRFQWFSADGQQPNVWVDRILRVPRPTRGVVSITFDDGYLTDLVEAKPVLDAHGMRAAAAINPDHVGGAGRMTEAQIDLLASAGWDIIGHSMNHDRQSDLPVEDMQADVRATRLWLAERNYKGGDIYAYPHGAQNAAVRATVADNFRHARGLASLTQTAWATDAFYSCSYQAGTAISLATVQGWIDTAVANGEWLHLTFHRLRTPTQAVEDWTPADFADLIDYLADVDVDVLPMSEVLDSIAGRQPDLPFKVVTQAAYDALDYPNPRVFYAIVG